MKLQSRRASFVVSSLIVLAGALASKQAHADCALGAFYDVQVVDNTVTVCLKAQSQVASCSASDPVLRQDTQTSEVLELPAFCAAADAGASADDVDGPCFVDECVPPGTYRYGLSTPYDCSQAGCGGVALFGLATVTSDLPASCARSSGDTGPTGTSATAPWGQGDADAGIPTEKECASSEDDATGGGCNVATVTDRSVLSANALAVLLGSVLLLVQARRKTRRG